jgi:hypothetical protein
MVKEVKRKEVKSKHFKKMAVFVFAIAMVAMLAVTASAADPVTLDFSGATAEIAPMVLGIVNQLIPVGVAIMIPILGIRLLPRIVYMFL